MCDNEVHSVQIQGATGSTEVKFQSSCGLGSRSLLHVAFFEGDQIDDDDTRDLLGPERWSPDCHLATLCNRFGADAAVLVVMPTTVSQGGQACYGNFLGSMTGTGEPLGFKPQGYKAAVHLRDILSGRCLGGVEAVADLVLVGFSKGAVVVNQLLAEMAWREEAFAPAADSAAMTAEVEPGLAAGPAGGPPAHWRRAASPAVQPPDDVVAVLDAVCVVHFLDAGLNCRGVHLTDPSVLAGLGQRHRRKPLVVHLHGTPRQWGDRRRPWIAQERDRFLLLLREAGVPVHVHHYFQGQPPSLRQHLDVIANMRLDGDTGPAAGEAAA